MNGNGLHVATKALHPENPSKWLFSSKATAVLHVMVEIQLRSFFALSFVALKLAKWKSVDTFLGNANETTA